MDQISTLISLLLESRTQSHIFHWRFSKTPGAGFGHLATGEFYETIGELIDKLVESFQGRNGLISGYKASKQFIEDTSQACEYYKSLVKMVELFRDKECCNIGYIQNQLDTIIELIYTTIYKLENMQ